MYQHCAAFEVIDNGIRVAATLVSERCVGAQLVTTSGLADRHRVEVRALEEHVLGLSCYAGVESAEYAGNTHRFFGIAYHQVGSRQRMFCTIQGDEFSTFGYVLNDNLMAFDFVCIESVQGLPHLVKHEVRGVHDVIDWTQPNRCECFLEPVG